MGYETYHIPVNYTDAGKLFGLFEIRNVVEAVLIGLPVLALCARFLPLVITWKITVSLFFFGPHSWLCTDWAQGRQFDKIPKNMVDLAPTPPGRNISRRGASA